MKNQYKKRYRLLIEQDGTSAIEQLEIKSGLVKYGLVVVGLLMLGVITGGAYLFGEFRAEQKMSQLVDENQLLAHQLDQVKGEMTQVMSSVDSLIDREEGLRLRVDLPPVDEDVRLAGVGTMVPREEEVIADARVEDLLASLDHLERRLSVTKQSYQEIQEKILTDEQRLKHIPSIMPLQDGRLTDGFGYRRDPFTKRITFHHGADFSSPRGTPVYATADGTVTRVYRAPGYGKMVKIDHGMGYTTIYGHLKIQHVRKGQRVTRGELIGEVGNTGRSTAPHLHYEVCIEDTPVDPLDYFYEGYQLWANR